MISPAMYLGTLRLHFGKLLILAGVGLLLSLIGERFQPIDYTTRRLLLVSAPGARELVELSQSNILAHEHAQSLAYLGNSGSALDAALRNLRLPASIAAECRASATVPDKTSYIEVNVWAPDEQLATTLGKAVATQIILANEGLAPGIERDSRIPIQVEDISADHMDERAAVAGRPRWLLLGAGTLALPVLAYVLMILRASVRPTVGQFWDLHEILPFPILGSIACRPPGGTIDPQLSEALGLPHGGSDARVIACITIDGLRDCHPVLELGNYLAEQGQRVLVVDADLRSPTLGSPISGGLADLLRGGSSGSAYEHAELVSSLKVLPTPKLAASTAHLTVPRARDAFVTLRSDAGVVLVSTPSALSGPDAALLADLSDDAILLADTRTSVDLLMDAGRSFREGSIRGLLVVNSRCRFPRNIRAHKPLTLRRR